MEKINWFIGHMASSLNKIKEQIKNIDLIIQVLDARATNITSNLELVNLAKNKLVLNVALKSDLADVNNKNNDIVYLSNKDKSFAKILEQKLICLLDEKIKKLQNKGLKNPHFYAMIIGLPNLGKSTLINCFAKHKKVNVENRPGVTKNINLIKINNLISIYDTPGILTKNIEKLSDGYKLGVLGCIDKKILPMHETIQYITDYYFEFCQDQIRKFFEYQEKYEFSSFINYIAKKYNFLKHQNDYDLERTYNFMFEIYSKNKICRVNYEKDN